MYCSTCGTELPLELSYCNRCGNNLRPSNTPVGDAPVSIKAPTAYISAAIAVITLGGFFTIFSFIMELLRRGIDLDKGPLMLVLFSLLGVVAVDFMLARLLIRILNRGMVQPSLGSRIQSFKSASETAQRRLDEPRIPVDSVTDHTTRTLPKEYVERGPTN